MVISNEGVNFFRKLSRIWRNFKDYTYLEGIKLSQEQISIIEREEDQLLIEGYAGTGKSLTLLYKFINILVRENNKKILYVTFNNTLIEDTKKRLVTCKEYVENKERHVVEIATFHEMAANILKEIKVIDRGIGKITIDKIAKMNGDALRRIVSVYSKYSETKFEEYKSLNRDERLYSTHDMNFVKEEVLWLKAMGFTELDKYLETERTGRSKRIRLTRNQRKTIFKIYEGYQKELAKNKYGVVLDLEDFALKILEKEYEIGEDLKYDYIFVDEMQDLDPMQILALTKLTKGSIVFSGDANQRIYKKSPIKYEELGLKVKQKGKRKVLKKNYRSTAEIIRLANSLKFYDDMEKLSERQFVKEGEKPIIHKVENEEKAIKYIINEIKKIHDRDPKKTIAIINREEIKSKVSGKSKFRSILEQKLIYHKFIDIDNYYKKFDYEKERQIFYTNPYDVKGLEFDAVFIIDFNNKYYPNAKEIRKIERMDDNKNKELLEEDKLEFINTEKKLLYVAMSRAKEKLFLIANNCDGEEEISEFIFDFKSEDYIASGFTKTKLEVARVHYNRIGNGKIFKKKEMEYREGSQQENIGLIQEKEIKDRIKKNDIKEDEKNNEFEVNQVKIKNKEIEQPNSSYRNEIENDVVENIVIPLLNKNKIKYVDKRSKGGALWIIAGLEIGETIDVFIKYGLKFKFSKTGGKSTQYREAWYTK